MTPLHHASARFLWKSSSSAVARALHTSRRPKDASLLRTAAFVGNAWVTAASGKTFAVIDPSTGEVVVQLPDFDVNDTKRAIETAQVGFRKWKSDYTSKQRHRILKKWHALIIENESDLARIVTLENGKPLKEALGEVRYGASFIEWFAEEARRVCGDVIPNPVHGQRLLVLQEPIGVAAIITPWNFPVAMITRKVGAALAAGCTTIIKPASETPLSALALAELGQRAGIPAGVINVITTSHKGTIAVGEELTSHKDIRKVSFTGSTNIGKLLMRQSAGTVKKVSLELGGNAPFIVFDDADLPAAVSGAMASKYRGSGQTCVCANRIFVHRSIQGDFASLLADKVNEELKLGDGFHPDTSLGPLINQKAVDKVQKHLDDALHHGAILVKASGQKDVSLESLGSNFFPPHVLKNCRVDKMMAFSEETFGPLACIYPFDTEEEVIRMANDTEMGLAAYFYTRDLAKVWRIAEALEVGMVGVNTGLISNEVAPFGGVKQSGIGREGSKYGIEEYMEKKYVCIGGLE